MKREFGHVFKVECKQKHGALRCWITSKKRFAHKIDGIEAVEMVDIIGVTKYTGYNFTVTMQHGKCTIGKDDVIRCHERHPIVIPSLRPG